VPSQTLRANLAQWAELLAADTVLVSLMKGVELGTAKRMSEVVEQVAGVAPERVAVLSGPNLAPEIAARRPAASVVACRDESVARRLQAACHTPYFRPYTNTDVVGCELGGAVKNVIALAVGIAEGMGLGDNAKASLITRGLVEMARLGDALGADHETFSGLAGMGDLIVSCWHQSGRNRRAGELIARGATPEEAKAQIGQVVEGLATAPVLRDLSRRIGVELPITEGVCAVLEGMPLNELAGSLMGRRPTDE
jgi:glycerol-3-phosphate dehydrogenase (NAD(P)+)